MSTVLYKNKKGGGGHRFPFVRCTWRVTPSCLRRGTGEVQGLRRGWGGGGGAIPDSNTVTSRMVFALRWEAMSHFNVSLMARSEVTAQCP